MIFIRSFSLLFLMVLIISCTHIPRPSFIENRNTHYLTAKNSPPLRIPPGLSSSAFDNYYPVSDRAYPESLKNVSIVPPGLASS